MPGPHELLAHDEHAVAADPPDVGREQRFDRIARRVRQGHQARALELALGLPAQDESARRGALGLRDGFPARLEVAAEDDGFDEHWMSIQLFRRRSREETRCSPHQCTSRRGPDFPSSRRKPA